MIISVVSPHSGNTGTTTTALLLAHGLADLKRKVFLTHISPSSPSIGLYLGLHDYEDKTSTPTQLVKLLREGAVQAEDVSDYCQNVDDFLDVFVNTKSNFSPKDMSTLHDFLMDSIHYEYTVFDIDSSVTTEEARNVIKRSELVILNVGDGYADLDKFVAKRDDILKMCAGKSVLLVCSDYDPRGGSTKDITKRLDMQTTCHVMRSNVWIKYLSNRGNLSKVFTEGKKKDGDVVDVYKDAYSLASSVAKAKINITKRSKGALRND